jgi:hypothetical protein
MLLIWVGLSVPAVECRGQVVRRPAQCLRQGREGLRAPSARVDVALQLAQGGQRDPGLPRDLHLGRAQLGHAIRDRTRDRCPVFGHIRSKQLGVPRLAARTGANRDQDHGASLTLMPIKLNIDVNIRGFTSAADGVRATDT